MNRHGSSYGATGWPAPQREVSFINVVGCGTPRPAGFGRTAAN